MRSGRDAKRTHTRGRALARRAAELHASGDGERPVRLYERAIALLEESAPDDPELARALCNFGLLRKGRGELDEARRLYESALPRLRRAVGASHDDVATLLHNLAELYKALARACAKRSRAVARDARDLERSRSRAMVRSDLARYPLTVAPSAIHRFGVFAAARIPAGKYILEYTGERVSRREAMRRWSVERTYLARLDLYWNIDGSVGGSGAELVNHACEPNVRLVRAGGGLWLRSQRAIRKGEELLLDYALPRDSPRVDCFCGAATCRGSLNVD